MKYDVIFLYSPLFCSWWSVNVRLWIIFKLDFFPYCWILGVFNASFIIHVFFKFFPLVCSLSCPSLGYDFCIDEVQFINFFLLWPVALVLDLKENRHKKRRSFGYFQFLESSRLTFHTGVSDAASVRLCEATFSLSPSPSTFNPFGHQIVSTSLAVKSQMV